MLPVGTSRVGGATFRRKVVTARGIDMMFQGVQNGKFDDGVTHRRMVPRPSTIPERRACDARPEPTAYHVDAAGNKQY